VSKRARLPPFAVGDRLRQCSDGILRLAGLERMAVFWTRKATGGSTVELFDLSRNGAALSWTDDRSRAIALEMFVELARRLEGTTCVERLRLSGPIGDPIDVPDTERFVRAAPSLLTRKYRKFSFEFRLNEGARRYEVSHLDQSIPGIGFETPGEGESFWSALGAVFADFAERETGVAVSTGPWYQGNSPSVSR
jgi:hypothetical protein